MAENDDFKVEGAALSQHEMEAPRGAGLPAGGDAPAENDLAGQDSGEEEEGEIPQTPAEEKAAMESDELEKYRWCKCFCDPRDYNGQDHYFLHLDSKVSQWHPPPGEPYWIWDAEKQELHATGLHYPPGVSQPSASRPASSDGPDPNYQGYNPKIHGNYDPNADYAKYHEKSGAERQKAEEIERERSNARSGIGLPTGAPPPAPIDYSTTAVFNRYTGSFQDADHSTDRHNDFNKSGRQMGAYFDVDAAANAHDGRSLKEERRNEKLSKNQIKELAKKRREKKEKKRLDWLTS